MSVIGVHDWHCPVWHVCPVEQLVAHAPQWSGLAFKSTQVSPHFWKPGAHAVLHEPLAQMAGAMQTLPQAPQLLFSDCRLTHAPLHGVRPG